MSLVSEWLLLVRMERRTSRSLSELAEAGEEKSLLGKEVEKLTGISSLDTLVPEEEVEAPLSTNQVLYCGLFFWIKRNNFIINERHNNKT